jgi:peptidoglycan hydrolase-like protein with peptidoglycan-binding domain
MENPSMSSTRTRLALLAAIAAIGGSLALSPAAQAAPAAAPAATVAPMVFGCDFTNATPTIRRGSTGAAVREAQCLLNFWGSGPIAVDGDFGPATDAAVRRFQSTFCGLVVDGIVGPNTWRALRTSGC